LAVAQSVEYVLPENYHDRIVDEHSVSKDFFEEIVDRNNKICLKLNLQYIWSVMILDNKIVFTTATSPSKDVNKGDHASFLEAHTNPDAFKRAFSTMKNNYSSFHNKWGHGRMVLVPGYDSKGRRYLFGASMNIKDVDLIVKKSIMNSLMISTAVFLFGILLSFRLADSFSNPIVNLTQIAENIAKGDYEQRIDVRGSSELESLSENLYRMSNAINEKIQQIENQNISLQKEIIERKEAESALQKAERRYKNLFEEAPVMYVITRNLAGKPYIVDCNELFLRSLGYSREQILNKPIADFYTPESVAKLRDGGYRKPHADPFIEERQFIARDGRVIETVLRAITDEGSGGEDIGTRAMFLDITEMKNIQKEKERLEAQLQQSQKMEAIGTLAGGIAHDFNNILSPIMMQSEMAMMDLPPDNPLQHNLKQIFQATERARDMVKQILAFSRKEQQERAPIRLGIVLKEAIKLLRSWIPTTIDIRHHNDAKIDIVLANHTQIQQMILNLCTNASHAMREKGGVLEIGLNDRYLDSEAAGEFEGLNPGPYLMLTVKDTGHGVAPEVISRIFDPYFTTKAVGEGTGMGLSVSHGIVKSHYGDITVESELGKGTTFQVLFPKFEEDIPTITEPAVQLPRGTERILCVDDEKAAVDTIKVMLEKLGYEISVRTSSIEALELFRNKPDAFDLIITDMTMPNMTGKELAQKIMEIRSGLPIILCTGFSEQIDEKRAKEMGISSFVMKPIAMFDIANTIRNVLDDNF